MKVLKAWHRQAAGLEGESQNQAKAPCVLVGCHDVPAGKGTFALLFRLKI